MIELGKKYQTRDGRAVRILCVDGAVPMRPVTGFIEGCSSVLTWAIDGYASTVGPAQDWDLVPVPTKHEGYAVIRDSKCEYGFYVFSTREVAAKYLHRCEPDLPEGRHIVPVTWES